MHIVYLQRILGFFALVKKDLDTKVVDFTELFLSLCAKGVISPTITELAGKVSMAQNSQTKTSS